MSVKQGFLTKEGGSIKTWKKRYFVMKNGALIYSKKADTSNLGTISPPLFFNPVFPEDLFNQLLNISFRIY